MHGKKKVYTQVFDTGFLISIASLFYFPSSLYLLFLFVVLTILRPFSLREWLIGAIAFVIPYFLIAVYYFWNNKLSSFINDHITCYFEKKNFDIFLDTADLILLAWLVMLLVIIFIYNQIGFYRIVARIRNYIVVIMWFLFFGVISFVLLPVIKLSHFYLLVTPIAVLLAYYLSEFKKGWLGDLLIIILIGLIFINLVY